MWNGHLNLYGAELYGRYLSGGCSRKLRHQFFLSEPAVEAGAASDLCGDPYGYPDAKSMNLLIDENNTVREVAEKSGITISRISIKCLKSIPE